MKQNWLRSKKAENLVYILCTLRLIAQKKAQVQRGSFQELAPIHRCIYVDEETESNGLVEQPPVTIPSEELVLASNDYMERLLTVDLRDDDYTKHLETWLSTMLCFQFWLIQWLASSKCHWIIFECTELKLNHSTFWVLNLDQCWMNLKFLYDYMI